MHSTTLLTDEGATRVQQTNPSDDGGRKQPGGRTKQQTINIFC